MTSVLAHAIAGRAHGEGARSGDRAVVIERSGGALVAAIDGLGHGDAAAAAAEEAAAVLAADPGLRIEELIARCHERLRVTRGAVISLASFDAARGGMRWLGVGNVDGVVVRGAFGADGADQTLVTVGGIVGYTLPALVVRELEVRAGDTLVLVTDGIGRAYRDEISPLREPQQIADRILERHGKRADDACVVVARYHGGHAGAYDDEGASIDVDGEAGVSEARIRTRARARLLGFGTAETEALATAVSELARNLVIHAVGGEIAFSTVRDGDRAGLVVTVRDRGPGIADVARALEDGYSTAGGLGCGLSGARRLVDDFHVESELGAGTVVTIKKWVR